MIRVFFTITYLPLLLLLISCGAQTTDTLIESPQNAVADTETTDEPKQETQPIEKPQSNNWEKLVMLEIRDQQGTVTSRMPFPQGWKMQKAAAGQPSLVGPNGVQVINYPYKSFIYVNDPQMQQMYYQSGQTLRYWPGAEQWVQQDLVQPLGQEGWQLQRWYPVPEVARMDKWYNDQLYKAMPAQLDVLAIGSEWRDANGDRAFIISHIIVSTDQTMQTWYYFSSLLTADEDHFDRAVKQYIFSMANTRYELGPIMAYNQREAQKAGQSWAAFNQRMAQNQAAFERQQRNYVNNSNAINDAIMDGWKERNASSDRMQEKTVDGIWEQGNAVNSSTGDQYKTSNNYNHYWINSRGEYISTNQSNYDPNLDQDLNGSNWEQLQKVD